MHYNGLHFELVELEYYILMNTDKRLPIAGIIVRRKPGIRHCSLALPSYSYNQTNASVESITESLGTCTPISFKPAQPQSKRKATALFMQSLALPAYIKDHTIAHHSARQNIANICYLKTIRKPTKHPHRLLPISSLNHSLNIAKKILLYYPIPHMPPHYKAALIPNTQITTQNCN